jgi:nucleoside-diphosphate-sugar epimerase
MKILITGARGFLGKYTVDLLEKEHELIALDLEQLDILDAESVFSVVAAKSPDVIVHFAALCGAKESEEDPFGFFSTNTNGTLNILEACRLNNVKKIIFTSSLTVYGKCEGGVVEDSRFAPRHPYAYSKVAAEYFIRSYTKNYGLQSIILRPTLVVGEGCKELHAVGDFLRTALDGKIIEIYGKGDHVRDFMHPEDCATAVEKALQKIAIIPEGTFESYNLSTGEYMSITELAKMIISRTGKGDVVNIGSTNQTFSLFTSIDRAKTGLNWRPKVMVSDIIERLLNT